MTNLIRKNRSLSFPRNKLISNELIFSIFYSFQNLYSLYKKLVIHQGVNLQNRKKSKSQNWARQQGSVSA